ncbi:MAG: glucose-6-phosphate isomerase, partial [Alphaproteobacteria bacterium]|nr:glucose-6-phosphate isomerase [Alphaproteobacteria bacterium]
VENPSKLPGIIKDSQIIIANLDHLNSDKKQITVGDVFIPYREYQKYIEKFDVNKTKTILSDKLAKREEEASKLQHTLQKMKAFSDAVRVEKRFTHIVNIGIGGSDLGPAMTYEALKYFTDKDISLYFVSNVDASHLNEVLRRIDAEKTLFIVTSKTFTTQETMTNAHSAREWLYREIGKTDIGDHFVAISQNATLAKEFGIKEDNIFPIWPWVGGRFSLWSAVGLPLCIALGFEQFEELLCGANAMDKHFKTAPLRENLPVIMGLIGMWNRNFLKHETLAVIPYNQYLHRFPDYLQQLDMESNGKSVDRQGRRVPYATGPVIFGESGTNAQHAFFQLLHQGTTIIPCEFIAFVNSQAPMGDHQTKLLANAFAQSKAMMDGKDSDNPNTVFEGNRPSTTILLKNLTPYSLGMLIALYEHKIFVQGILWNINSFDQCGVELGKILAQQIIPSLSEKNHDCQNDTMDASTQNLIEITKKMS